MRVSREDARENRERVVEKASHLFREHGYDGIGIASLMKSAGLTNGAFYKQFSSKDALITEATAHAITENLGAWRKSIGAAGEGNPAKAVASWYLSDDHAKDRASGCALAALGGDVPRQNPEVRQAVDQGLREMVNLLSGEQAEVNQETRKAALQKISTMVGAVLLSRAVDDADLKEEILQAAAEDQR